MSELFTYLSDHPEIPLGTAILAVQCFNIYTFKGYAQKHYDKDEALQEKMIDVLKDILRK